MIEINIARVYLDITANTHYYKPLSLLTFNDVDHGCEVFRGVCKTSYIN